MDKLKETDTNATTKGIGPFGLITVLMRSPDVSAKKAYPCVCNSGPLYAQNKLLCVCNLIESTLTAHYRRRITASSGFPMLWVLP